MIALSAGGRKGPFATQPNLNHFGRDRLSRKSLISEGVTGTLAESYCCPTSANRRPCCLAKRKSCVGPVLSVPDSSAPSPPGPSGSGLFAGELNPNTGPTKVGPFCFWAQLDATRLRNAQAAGQLRFRTCLEAHLTASRALHDTVDEADFNFDAFSSREPASTSLENALVL
jgi:hypothetical protein